MEKGSLRFSVDRVSDLLEFARVASEAKNVQVLRSKTLPLARKIFESESTIIWLTDQNNHLSEPMEENVPHHFFPLYRNYYHRKNPFDPVNMGFDPANMGPFAGGAFTMEQIVPYRDFKETEYFNDFIRPQKIRRQMVVYVRVNNQLTSAICTHRTKNRQFDKEDLAAGKMVSLQLSAAFERIQMLQEVKKKGSFFQTLLESTDVGIAALDLGRNPLFMNRKAVDICESVKKGAFSGFESHQGASPIPPPVLKDCEALEECTRNDQKVRMDSFPTRKRIVWISSTEKCLFRSRMVSAGVSGVGHPLFLITMDPLPLHPKLNDQAVKDACHLTKRESEIVSYIFKGYRNAEIAKTLYISEGTVKNHLRNIFEKADVKNRTGLIHKVLSL